MLNRSKLRAGTQLKSFAEVLFDPPNLPAKLNAAPIKYKTAAPAAKAPAADGDATVVVRDVAEAAQAEMNESLKEISALLQYQVSNSPEYHMHPFSRPIGAINQVLKDRWTDPITADAIMTSVLLICYAVAAYAILRG